MKGKQVFRLLCGMGVGLLLLGVMLWLPARAVRSQTLSETEIEQARARAAEQATRPYRIIPPTVSGGVAPLFVGVDSLTIPAYTIDVTANTFFTAFVGVETWGATYDPDNGRVLIMDGTELWEWPVGGTPNFLGQVAYDGGNITLPGLAYYDGTLYGARTVGTEGIYTVDLSTPGSPTATLFITYADPPATIDIGGIDFDPASGLLYAVNDGSGQRGLVLVNSDGTLTLVAPYLDGETDVDGLGIGDGKAYLITDDPTPAYFNVYDLVSGSYTNTVVNPWTVDEVFAGGAWIGSVIFTPTINVQPTAIARDLLPNTQVTELMTIGNVGSGSLMWQIVEEEAATVWGNRSAAARPLLETSSSANSSGANSGGCTPGDIPWLAVSPTSGTIFGGNQDVTTVTFDASGYMPGIYTGTLCVESNDAATPLVPVPLTMTVLPIPPTAAIVLSKTVGTEMDVCATTSTITVTMGTAVNYCYHVTNTGNLTLSMHTLEDSALGNLLLDYPYELGPGQSTQVQVSTTLTTSVINTATWTAVTDDELFTAVDTTSASVTVTPPPPTAAIVLSKTVGTEMDVCATTQAITVTTGTAVNYCYHVTNTGDITLSLHTLEDSALGNLLPDFPYELAPGQSTQVQVSTTLTTSVINTATWTAVTDDELFTAVDTASASVTVTPMFHIYLPVILKP